MAYRVRNLGSHPVVLTTYHITIPPGAEVPVTEIGTKELELQRAGVIAIERTPNSDDNKDDAKYVEIINSNLSTIALRPKTPSILNEVLTDANVWYLLSSRVSGILGWKLQLRRPVAPALPVGFDYKYDSASALFMSCVPGEAITADTDFPSLYVRCPSRAGEIAELEYWVA